jgi:multidrug efflux pump subunit AcrB
MEQKLRYLRARSNLVQQAISWLVHRPQAALLLVLLILGLGLSSLWTISKAEDPETTFPIVTAVVLLPGADAEAIEKLIAIPMERAVSGIQGLKSITTSSRTGVVRMSVEFNWDVNPERKYDEVVQQVSELRPSLPTGIRDIEFILATTAYANIVQYAVVGNGASMPQMVAVARNLEEEIERVPGIQEAEIWGAPFREVKVGIDPVRLASLKVSPSDIVSAITRESDGSPIGVVEDAGNRLTIGSRGYFEGLDEIAATPVLLKDGQSVTVGELASVGWGDAADSHIARYRGKRAIFVTARTTLGQDVLATNAKIQQRIEQFRAGLPASVRLETGFQQAANIETRLSRLQKDFLLGLVLVLLTLAPLGLRAGLIVMTAIPLSLGLGIALLQFFGFSLNQLSITGFVIALGLLVDDSIVVTENVVRHLRNGESPYKAVTAALSEIDIAIIGCTATLILAFIPLLMLPEGSGEFIRSLPAAVVFTVLASLFVALTVIPVLAARFLKPQGEHGNTLLSFVNRAINHTFRPTLRMAINYPKTTVAFGLLLCFVSFGLAGKIGFTLFPASDTPQFLVQLEMPEGTSLAQTSVSIAVIEKRILAEPEVAWTMSNAGEGNPNIYYNYVQLRSRTNIGDVYGSFGKWDPERSPQTLQRIESALAGIPGARITVRRFENGPPIEAPVAVRVSGSDINTLSDLSAEIAKRIESTGKLRNIRDPLAVRRTDISLAIAPEVSARYGVSPNDVNDSARVALSGVTAGQFVDVTGDVFPISVGLPVSGTPPIDTLQKITIWTPDGRALPVSDVTTPKIESNLAEINRYQKQRTATITAYPAPGVLASEATAEVQEILAKLKIPPGYSVSYGGQAEAAQSSFAGLGAASMIALFGILAVLVLEFGSFRASAVVAFVIPFGIAGGILALYLAGETLSFIAAVGFIALIGIEIKNSILLVDFANQRRKAGASLTHAIVEASEARFLPVLLTSITAIAGLTPLILDNSPLLSPLALVLTGGLISSTLLARIVTPAIYILLSPRDKGQAVE